MVQISAFTLATLAIANLAGAVPLARRDDSYSYGMKPASDDQAAPASGGCPAMPAPAPAPAPAAGASPKAIYFITNDPKANSVVALPVGADGKLSQGSITATGGVGSAEVDPKTGAPTIPDALSSQGAVRVAGGMVFAVNAGSNTLSMMAIDAADPTKLTMLGAPVDTLGEFPVTLAVSAKNSLACVGNTGAKAGIACSRFTGAGLSPMDNLRPFQLNQKTPPTGPLNTVADTFFNTDETALLTTVKGDPTVNNTGFLSSFPVTNGALSTAETRSSPTGTAVLFGTVPIPGTTNLLATDASFGAAVLGLDGSNRGTVLNKLAIGNQKATCWAAVSPATQTGFVTDVGVNHLVEVDVNSAALIRDLPSTNGNPGMIDLVARGNFIYALSPGNANVTSAVTVFDVSGGKGTAKEIQNFNPTGVTATAQGMAVL